MRKLGATLALVGLLVLGATPALATQEVCPEDGKQTGGGEIVYDAGTEVCIKAGTDVVYVIADGTSDLNTLIGNGHEVSHHTVIEVPPTTTTTVPETTTTTVPETTTTTEAPQEQYAQTWIGCITQGPRVIGSLTGTFDSVHYLVTDQDGNVLYEEYTSGTFDSQTDGPFLIVQLDGVEGRIVTSTVTADELTDSFTAYGDCVDTTTTTTVPEETTTTQPPVTTTTTPEQCAETGECLPYTGLETGQFALIGAALAAMGLTMLYLARRQEETN